MAPPTPVHVNIEQKQGDAINSTAIKHQYKVVADALCELHTHFNQYGAYELAKCVVSGMKHLRLPVADHVINFAGYDPSYPAPKEDLHWPNSPYRDTYGKQVSEKDGAATQIKR